MKTITHKWQIRSLRLRLTLLTMFALLGATVSMTMLLNQNISHRMQATAKPISKAIELIPLDGAMQTAPPTPATVNEALAVGEVGVQAEKLKPVEVAIQMELTTATTAIEKYSYLVLLFIVLGGGICTYFIAGRALAPVQALSDEIQRITVNNLNQRLEPDACVQELRQFTTSFNEMLESLSKAFEMQKRFSASAAHELRTPIAILQSNIEVLQDEENVSIEEYQNFHKIAKRTVARMDALVVSLLELTNVQNCTLLDAIPIQPLMRDLFSDYRQAAQVKNVQFTLQNDARATIAGNRELLYTAIANLIENAMKHNCENSRIWLCTQVQENELTIRVQDDGKGIDEESLALIFEPFYRVEKSRARAHGGAGLGLYLADQIIRIHKGRIAVSSTLNQGSVFEIILPLSMVG